MKIVENIVIDNSNIAFQSDIGNSYQLNNIAKQIINLMKQGLNKQEIVKSISVEYCISENDIYIDVSDFFSRLKHFSLAK